MLSQKPYLIRAIHEWCLDNELTPYLATVVDESTNVPQQHVQNGQIVFNVSDDAVESLVIGLDWLTFDATFNGAVYNISIPINNIIAIYAQENGQGLQFEVTKVKHKTEPKHGLKLVK